MYSGIVHRHCTLSLKYSLELPHSVTVLALHHDGQLFTGIGLPSRSCVAVDCTVNSGCTGLHLLELEVVCKLVEACSASLFELLNPFGRGKSSLIHTSKLRVAANKAMQQFRQHAQEQKQGLTVVTGDAEGVGSVALHDLTLHDIPQKEVTPVLAPFAAYFKCMGGHLLEVRC